MVSKTTSRLRSARRRSFRFIMFAAWIGGFARQFAVRPDSQRPTMWVQLIQANDGRSLVHLSRRDTSWACALVHGYCMRRLADRQEKLGRCPIKPDAVYTDAIFPAILPCIVEVWISTPQCRLTIHRYTSPQFRTAYLSITTIAITSDLK
ncbi:hypothetical protein D3C80_1741010 [compost metagenome]